MLDLADYRTLFDHNTVWGIYLAAAAVLLLAFAQLTKRWWFELRWLLFALIAVFLFMPAPLPGRDLLAPAMIMVALSPFTGAPELIGDVLARLLLGGAVAVIAISAISIIRRIHLRRS